MSLTYSADSISRDIVLVEMLLCVGKSLFHYGQIRGQENTKKIVKRDPVQIKTIDISPLSIIE